MKLRNLEKIQFLLAGLTVVISILVQPFLPQVIVTHWGIDGQANGYSSREFGMLFISLIILGVSLVGLVAPRIDPLKKNIKEFRSTYESFILTLILFLIYLFFLTLAWNLGIIFNMITFLVPAFSVLLYVLGGTLAKTKRNWFIGIRTPWTMSDDRVWAETHKTASILFKLTAGITLFGILVPQFTFWFFIIPTICVGLGSVVYSYFVYRRLHRA